MPGYPYKPILAADPNNPSIVATNAAVLIFNPGDPTKTPVTIWDLAKTSEIPNPVTTNSLGFGPAFLHDTLPQLAWEGGGMSNTFESFQGLWEDAEAAKGAAHGSATSAQESAASSALAATNAAAGVATALAATVAEAEAAKLAAQAAAGLVDAPAGSAVLAAISEGGAARGELNAAIGAQTEPVVNGLVAEAIAADPTVANAAAAAAGPAVTTALDTSTRIPYPATYQESSVTITDANGQPTFLDANATDGGPTPHAAALIATALSAPVVITEISAYGDSMVEGIHGAGATWPAVLATELSRVVNNYGKSGQRSVEVAIRAGGVVPLITLPSNTVPASGSVTVTCDSPADTSLFSAVITTAAGTIAGIPATLTRSAAGVWTLTRNTAGTATPSPPRSPFLVTVPNPKGVQIIWVGRNDTIKDTAFTSIKATVDRMPAGTPFIIISICNNIDEPAGSAGYLEIQTLNRKLQDAYPKAFVDMRWFLVNQGLAEAGITPTTGDNDNIAQDIIPASLRSDGIHINSAGRSVTAKRLATIITRRGI